VEKRYIHSLQNVHIMPVFSITGPFQAGKTTLAFRVADKLREHGLTCGGVLSPGTDERAYVNISDGSKQPYFSPGEDLVEFDCRDITKKAIAFGCSALIEGNKADILFIDEIGKLEAAGKGFYSVLKDILPRRTDPVVAIIRKDNVQKMKALFNVDITMSWELRFGQQVNFDQLASEITKAVVRSIQRKE